MKISVKRKLKQIERMNRGDHIKCMVGKTRERERGGEVDRERGTGVEEKERDREREAERQT